MTSAEDFVVKTQQYAVVSLAVYFQRLLLPVKFEAKLRKRSRKCIVNTASNAMFAGEG